MSVNTSYTGVQNNNTFILKLDISFNEDWGCALICMYVIRTTLVGPVTLEYGLTRSHAEGAKATHRESASVSVRKRRQASVIVHFQAVTASLFAATASIRGLPRIKFLFKNSWSSVAVRGSPIIRESATERRQEMAHPAPLSKAEPLHWHTLSLRCSALLYSSLRYPTHSAKYFWCCTVRRSA